jgi:phage baseplate assembly protein W
MSAVKDFLGAGWKFPPALDSRGCIALVKDEQDVEEAIRLILLTRKGERPMRPEFGCEIHNLLFSGNDQATAGLARRYVHEALARWEPRIQVEEVFAEPDPLNQGRLMISIKYTIPATNAARNLVFPFYTIPGED